MDFSQTSLGPVAGQGARRPFSVETLSYLGPRKHGQSSPALRVHRSGGSGSPGFTATRSSPASAVSLFVATPQPLISTHASNVSERIGRNSLRTKIVLGLERT